MWGLRVSCVDLDLGAAEQHFMNDSYICSLFLFRAVIIINRSVYSILYMYGTKQKIHHNRKLIVVGR